MRHLFTIIKPIKKGEYVYALVPNHPHATASGYVLMHRVVMENHIGRLLKPHELVYHKDEDKKNNDIANLEIVDVATHNRIHHYVGRKYKGICAHCGEPFERAWRNRPEVKKQARAFCSHSCRGKFYKQATPTGTPI